MAAAIDRGSRQCIILYEIVAALAVRFIRKIQLQVVKFEYIERALVHRLTGCKIVVCVDSFNVRTAYNEL